MAHFELISFLGSATGLLALISFCLLVFGRLGVGSIVAFLIAGLVVAILIAAAIVLLMAYSGGGRGGGYH